MSMTDYDVLLHW